MGAFLNQIKDCQPNHGVEARIKSALSDEEYADLLVAFADTTIGTRAITIALLKHGVKLGVSSVQTLRKKYNDAL